MAEAPLVPGYTSTKNKPIEDLASCWRRISPNRGSLHSHMSTNLQLPNRLDIESSVRELFISKTAEAQIGFGLGCEEKGHT